MVRVTDHKKTLTLWEKYIKKLYYRKNRADNIEIEKEK